MIHWMRLKDGLESDEEKIIEIIHKKSALYAYTSALFLD